MKSRIVILSMLVFGMLLSTAGAGLAVSGSSGQNDASVAQYGQAKNDAPAGGGDVLGDEDSGTNAAPNDDTPGGGVQPSRQVEAGANTGSSLPFTGFAAVPILVGGIALLSAGLVLRRRTGAER
jgi:hypothetical protein